MARAPLNFRQRDVTAAIKAAKRSGADRFRVEIDHGKIIVVIGEQDKVPASANAGEAEEWTGDEKAF